MLCGATPNPGSTRTRDTWQRTAHSFGITDEIFKARSQKPCLTWIFRLAPARARIDRTQQANPQTGLIRGAQNLPCQQIAILIRIPPGARCR